MLFGWENVHVQTDFGYKVFGAFNADPRDFFEQFQRIVLRRQDFLYPLVQAFDSPQRIVYLFPDKLEHVHMVDCNKPLAGLENFIIAGSQLFVVNLIDLLHGDLFPFTDFVYQLGANDPACGAQHAR